MNCPSCGQAIGFRSERAPYTVCSSCDTMVIRKDIDVEALGKVAECQPDGSPVQVGTRGRYDGHSFEVVGRMQLAYAKGYWNEWFLLLDNGEEAWLGEAMGQYFFSRAVEGPAEVRPIAVGASFRLGDTDFIGVDHKQVQVVGFEGELPFMVQAQSYFTCDLRNADGEALTIDFADGKASYYRGRMVFFPQLGLTGLRQSEDPSIAVPASQVKKVTCSSCGAPHELATGPQSKLLVCQYCGSAMDSSNPELQVLENYCDRAKVLAAGATIPIGTPANLQDGTYQVIGFVVQSTTVEGIIYHWKEYLLYNHLNGYLWLSESNGHFTLFTPLEGVPTYAKGGLVGRPEGYPVYWEGKKFRHFQTSKVVPSQVLGEFYWRLDVNEESTAVDYVAPPYLLSASVVSGSDITWSLGRYLETEELAEIFPTVQSFGKPSGIAPNQVNPNYAHRRWMLKPALATLVLAFLFVYSGLFLPGQKTVYKSKTIEVSTTSDTTVLVEKFTLPGKSNRGVRVKFAATMKDRWATFTPYIRSIKPARGGLARNPGAPMVLLADAPGAASQGEVYITPIAAGVCELRVDQVSGPPVEVPALVDTGAKPQGIPLYTFTVEIESVKNSPAKGALFWVFALLGYAFFNITSKASKFETKRWYESDYG